MPLETIDRTFSKIKKKTQKAVNIKNRVLERLKVEYERVDKLKPNAYNPNRQSDHDFQLLLRSIEEDGFTQPIVCARITSEHLKDDKFKTYAVGDIVIVDGEHRWRAARHFGMEEVPIVLVEQTPEQMRIATLRHNRARGSEDVELSAEVLRDLRELGALDWAQSSLMLDDVELSKLLDDISAPEILASEIFSQSWEPTKSLGSDSSDDKEVSVSAAVADTVREREKNLKQAKTQEERQQILRDKQVFTLELVYSGEDGKLVKTVLGSRPAEKILSWCREAKVAKRGKR